MRIYKTAGVYIKEELPESFVIDIFDEFGMTQSSESNVEAILAARANIGPDGKPDLSRHALQSELKRYKVVSETLDVEEEQKRIDAEGIKEEVRA
jgi:hypothetical protein